MKHTSVIIPTFNHAHYLPEAVKSVLEQILPADEIIVVDDGSTDNTCEVVAQFGSQVKYIRQENQGLAAARNTGIRAAKGELIGLLDADDLYEPNFLSRLVSILTANPKADAVYCIAQSIDANNQPLPERIGKVVPSEQLYTILLKGGFFPPICLLAYKYCYQAEGYLFDPSLRRVEDLDLWLKFAQRYTIIGTDDVLTRYRIMPTGLSSNPSLVLGQRLTVLQRHFGNGFTNKGPWTLMERQAFGRSYLAAACEYLQLRDPSQAYPYFCKAFETSPELTSELEVFYELALGDQPKGFRDNFSTLNIPSNARILMQMLDQLFDRPQIPETLRMSRHEAYANANLALGLQSYIARQFPAARRYLLQAIAWNPTLGFKKRVLTTLAKSLLPVSLVNWSKRKRLRPA